MVVVPGFSIPSVKFLRGRSASNANNSSTGSTTTTTAASASAAPPPPPPPPLQHQQHQQQPSSSSSSSTPLSPPPPTPTPPPPPPPPHHCPVQPYSSATASTVGDNSSSAIYRTIRTSQTEPPTRSLSLRAPSTSSSTSGLTPTTATTCSNAVAAPRPALILRTETNASASDMLRAVAGQRYEAWWEGVAVAVDSLLLLFCCCAACCSLVLRVLPAMAGFCFNEVPARGVAGGGGLDGFQVTSATTYETGQRRHLRRAQEDPTTLIHPFPIGSPTESNLFWGLAITTTPPFLI